MNGRIDSSLKSEKGRWLTLAFVMAFVNRLMRNKMRIMRLNFFVLGLQLAQPRCRVNSVMNFNIQPAASVWAIYELLCFQTFTSSHHLFVTVIWHLPNLFADPNYSLLWVPGWRVHSSNGGWLPSLHPENTSRKKTGQTGFHLRSKAGGFSATWITVFLVKLGRKLTQPKLWLHFGRCGVWRLDGEYARKYLWPSSYQFLSAFGSVLEF